MKLIKYKQPEISRSNSIDPWFDSFFGEIFRNSGLVDNKYRPSGSYTPVTNYDEDENNYTLRVELPGVKKSDIQIEQENNILTISGEHKSKSKDEEKSYKYKQSISLPDGVDLNKSRADYENGILNITLPKQEKKKKQILKIN